MTKNNPDKREEIENVKNNLRLAENPFWDDSYIFKQAIRELRKEGEPIIFDREFYRYYNANTISEIWGYSIN